MSEVNPMTDLGVYTYTEVFEASKQSQVHYQTKKKEFHRFGKKKAKANGIPMSKLVNEN